MKTKYKYIHFDKFNDCWYVEMNKNKSSPPLGVIKWYPKWSRYCFIPNKYIDTIFSQDCLADITDFIKQLPKPHKE